MDILFTGAFLVRQFVGLISAFWPIGVCLTATVVLGTYLAKPLSREIIAKCGFFVLIILAIALATLIIGAIVHQPSLTKPNFGYQEPAPWAGVALQALMVFQFVISVVFMMRSKGHRALSSALVLLGIWVGVLCYALAMMAISGTWL